MTGEDAADASSVTEKCSPEREEREQEEQAEGKLKPQIRPLTAGKQTRPAWRPHGSIAAVLKVTEDVCFHSNVRIFIGGRTARDFTKRTTHMSVVCAVSA